MASIRLLLPPGIEFRLKDLQSCQWPPLAPAAAIAATPHPQFIHVMVSAPSSHKIETLRFVGLSWGELCVLDVTVDNPFGGAQTIESSESETNGREEVKARVTETSFQEQERFVMVRLRIPPSSGMLEANAPGVPIVFLLLDPNTAEMPSHSGNGSHRVVHDHAFLLICEAQACTELLKLWQSMLGAVSTEQQYRQEQGQEQKGTEGEAASALASLDLSFGGALGSGPKDKAHWSRTWRSFLLPFVHDVTGLLYTNHHLPLLQHELCHQMQAAGLAPTRKPPVPREQQPAALKTAEPSMQSPSYAKASTDDSSASAGLSYLLRPASRGDTVYKSVANALLSTDQQIKQEASSTEAPPAHDSSASGVDQEGQKSPPSPIEQRAPGVEPHEYPAQKIQGTANIKAAQMMMPGKAATETSDKSQLEVEQAEFDPTKLVTGILDLAMDALPLVDQLMNFLHSQPQDQVALEQMVSMCADTIRESLIWCNDQISASLSPAAMEQPAAAPSPFSAEGLQPTLHRLSSYLSSPINSPERTDAAISSPQAELPQPPQQPAQPAQQPSQLPGAIPAQEQHPSYSSLQQGQYPSRLLHEAAVAALHDESLQRWQAMQGPSPEREEVQWGRELQQRGFLDNMSMQIQAALTGFRGMTSNVDLDERVEDTYPDYYLASILGQAVPTFLNNSEYHRSLSWPQITPKMVYSSTLGPFPLPVV